MPSQTPTAEFTRSDLRVRIWSSNEQLGAEAADATAAIVRQAVEERGIANLLIATGNSQQTFLCSLRTRRGLPWPAVTIFHMDEYLGLPPGHSASFPAVLRRALIDHVPVGAFYPVPGHAANPALACEGYAALLRAHPLDLCVMGIGENGHLAFNDPPYADFSDPQWVKVVELDPRSRRQQVHEGHFASLDEVPTHAITLTIPALLSARQILCLVPELRKASAVARALDGPIDPSCPASILRRCSRAQLFLDRESASALADGGRRA